MEEMVEVRKEVSDMPCGNAIPAEDAGHQTEKDVAGRESDRVPAPEMNPKDSIGTVVRRRPEESDRGCCDL